MDQGKDRYFSMNAVLASELFKQYYVLLLQTLNENLVELKEKV